LTSRSWSRQQDQKHKYCNAIELMDANLKILLH
jgi:hypothetical protein